MFAGSCVGLGDAKMVKYSGKTALITGASSGIGAEFARALAARGMSTVLVARSTDALQRLAGELMERYKAPAQVISADLATTAGISSLIDELRGRGTQVDLLLNNAGFGLHGHFDRLSVEQQMDEIQVNIGSLVALTHALVPDMLARKEGTIINIASTLAFQPDPYMAVYGATKAFVLSFSAALAEEYAGTGVHALALCPGATATPFYAVSGGADVFAKMRMRTTQQVVATGLRALERGRTVVIDGAGNNLLFGLTGALPAAVGARMIGSVMRPKRA